MKGMSNNQIILSEAEKLAPATLHAIATAHHTAAQIEALAAQITVTEDDGTQHPGTTHDAEIMLAASELHTFDYWKKEGKSVKLHEKALIECYLWKYTTKPSKAQREAAEAEGKEAAPDPHYYPTKSHLFSCLQVQDSKPAPAGRFSSTAEIIAYNKKLAAERKAAAKAAAEQADTKNALDVLKQTECKAKAAFLAVPETDRKAQAEALSAWRKARQDIAAAEKPAEPTTKPAPGDHPRQRDGQEAGRLEEVQLLRYLHHSAESHQPRGEAGRLHRRRFQLLRPSPGQGNDLVRRSPRLRCQHRPRPEQPERSQNRSV